MDHDNCTIKNYVERGTGHLVVTSGIHYTSLSQFVQSDLGCYYIGHYKPCHLLVQTHTGFWQIAPILVSSKSTDKIKRKELAIAFNGSNWYGMMQTNLFPKYFLSLSFDRKFATLHPHPRIEVCVRYYLSCPCVLFTVWDLLFISSISVGRTGRPWDLSVAVEKGSNSLDWLAHEIIVMWGNLVFQWPRKGLKYMFEVWIVNVYTCTLSLPSLIVQS